MPEPGIHLETLAKPQLYSDRQLDEACQIAELLGRGKLVIAVPPDRTEPDR